MTAGKYEPQPVIAENRLIGFIEGRRVRFGAGQLAIEDLGPKHDIAANSIDRLVAAGIDQPSAGIRRQPGGPLFHRGCECLLARLFGQIEIAEQADQCREHTTRLPAKYLLDFPVYLARARHHARGHFLGGGRPDGSHFDASDPGAGYSRRNSDRFVEVLGLNQVVAA
jgi:hypothetical protein